MKTRAKVLIFVTAVSLATGMVGAEEWIELIGKTGLDSFKQPTGEWEVVKGVKLNPENDTQFVTMPGEGVLANGLTGKTKHLFAEMEHGDVELHLEFMVPKNSNSGLYFMGRYEIQILDSHGVENPQHHHCGGIYWRWKWPEEYGYEGTPPSVNAAKPAGEWQTYDVIFRAPKFDADGKKIKNAVFEKVVHNGKLIHKNQEVTGPTRAAPFHDEKPLGPIMIQGDHGPVAIRNFRIKKLQDK